MSSALGVSYKSVLRYKSTGKVPSKLYENARNIMRRASYSYMRKSGYSSKLASEARRQSPLQLVQRRDVIDDLIRGISDHWNRFHPDPNDPKHTSDDRIRVCIEKGLRRGKSIEEIENY